MRASHVVLSQRSTRHQHQRSPSDDPEFSDDSHPEGHTIGHPDSRRHHQIASSQRQRNLSDVRNNPYNSHRLQASQLKVPALNHPDSRRNSQKISKQCRTHPSDDLNHSNNVNLLSISQPHAQDVNHPDTNKDSRIISNQYRGNSHDLNYSNNSHLFPSLQTVDQLTSHHQMGTSHLNNDHSNVPNRLTQRSMIIEETPMIPPPKGFSDSHPDLLSDSQFNSNHHANPFILQDLQHPATTNHQESSKQSAHQVVSDKQTNAGLNSSGHGNVMDIHSIPSHFISDNLTSPSLLYPEDQQASQIISNDRTMGFNHGFTNQSVAMCPQPPGAHEISTYHRTAMGIESGFYPPPPQGFQTSPIQSSRADYPSANHVRNATRQDKTTD